MVRTGHSAASASAAIPELPYAPPPGVAATGIEVMTLSELRDRAARGGQRLADPQRPGFHQLFAVESGTLRQSVDFAGHTTGPGAWLWVRPGQVQQYQDVAEAEGTLILFQPAFPDPATAAAVGLDEATGAVSRHPYDEEARAVRIALDHLRFEFAAGRTPAARAAHTEVLRHLLGVLLLRLVRLAGTEEQGPDAVTSSEPFRRFRAAVEKDFARTRRVADYAHALGYSPRTLSRATRAAAGLGAKEFVDRRVILEAKRLLAHTDRSAARIAAALGFADATNFAKFFHQRSGTTPGAFRAGVRDAGERAR
ncbi:helix-turn-helix transcriptional regulator [Streptomyces spirodelae]|uniref:Helix-turn-helix transcriptional regulator n=1 Tax=Streptomyces spirodelae TaxID=2812904 RepID=A0ABS3WSW8_9ACTN|nr:helix-turn-helix transcriptional regulator [Streptomyces spirodelae]MBO8186214.1 helix-turn-helix transcriptional regulator [Streptomyces spirodelae]